MERRWFEMPDDWIGPKVELDVGVSSADGLERGGHGRGIY